MPGTTRQIFDQLQGSNGIVSQTPTKVSSVETALKLIQTKWNALWTSAGVDGQTYLQSKGLTTAYMGTVTDTNFTGSLSKTLTTTKSLATQSQKEFSPRMSVSDSYRSAKQRLQDTSQPLGTAIYEKMFNIHSQTFVSKFDPVITQAATVASAIDKLQTQINTYPIPAPVPPATVPVVNPAVETAATALKTQTDKQVTSNSTLKTAADTANSGDTNVMADYLKYISNANLAKVLPFWYTDTDKKGTIDNMASAPLINLIK